MEYLHSAKFAQDLNILCEEIEGILEEEPPVVFCRAQYVFGDIHGNLEDLKFFSENIWKMEGILQPANSPWRHVIANDEP